MSDVYIKFNGLKSGIAYQRPQLAGQTTSYRTGDDAWHLLNGTYDYVSPKYPNNYSKLSLATHKSVICNGTDEYLNLDNVLTQVSSSTQGTISLWYKPTDATPTNPKAIISFGDTNAQTDLLAAIWTDGTLLIVSRDNSEVEAWRIQTDNAVFTDNTVTHIAIVQDGVSPVIYIDGVAVAQTTSTTTDTTVWFNDLTNLDNGRLACRNRDGNGNELFSEGSFYGLLLTSDAKSSTEIMDIYNNGIVKSESSISNGVVNYNFNNSSDNYNVDVSNEWRFYDDISSITSDSANMGTSNLVDELSNNMFINLEFNNAFGNTYRFTDENGLQVYGSNYAIDHLTGLGWYLIVTISKNWNNSIDEPYASSQGGYTDWRLPSINEINSLFNFDKPDVFNYSPFTNFTTTLTPGQDLWTSTTDYKNTLLAYSIQQNIVSTQGYNVRRIAKTTTSGQNYIMCRNHYT